MKCFMLFLSKIKFSKLKIVYLEITHIFWAKIFENIMFQSQLKFRSNIFRSKLNTKFKHEKPIYEIKIAIFFRRKLSMKYHLYNSA